MAKSKARSSRSNSSSKNKKAKGKLTKDVVKVRVEPVPPEIPEFASVVERDKWLEEELSRIYKRRFTRTSLIVFSPQNAVIFDSDFTPSYYIEGDRKNDVASFITGLNNSVCNHILFYIHGFNTSNSNAIGTTEILQHMCNTLESSTLVVAIVWPCASQTSMLSNYATDRKTVSDLDFCQAVRSCLLSVTDLQNKKYSILSHSMGNFVVEKVLITEEENNSHLFRQNTFQNLFSFAADVGLNFVNRIKDTGYFENLRVFHFAFDAALIASSVYHRLELRLGLVGCSSLLNDLSINAWSLKQKTDRGHTYYLRNGHLPGDAFKDHVAPNLLPEN